MPQERIAPLTRVSGVRAGLAIALQWAVIAGAAAVAVWSGHPLAYVLAAIVIATRQHALLVLMHDGAHRLLARNRRVNDVVSDVMLAFPLFVSTALYRRHHFLHHRQLNTEEDPDLDRSADGRGRAEWLRILASDLLGLNVVKQLESGSYFSVLATLRNRELRAAMEPWQRALFVVQTGATAAALALSGGWLAYAVLWVLPSMTVLTMILRVRAVAEHVGCASDGVAGSRTVLPGPLERGMFAPCGVNYHLAHHLFPAVPAHNLPRLHALLATTPEFRAEAHVTRGYLLGSDSVLAEVSGSPPRG